MRLVSLDTATAQVRMLEEGDLEFVLEVTSWVSKDMI